MSSKHFKNIAVVSFIIISWGYIGYLLYTNPSLVKNTLSVLVDFFANHAFYTVSLIILCFANWSLESLKWYWLLRRFEKISYVDCFQSVLFGLAWSLFLPRTIGEFAGRLHSIQQKKQASSALVINKFIQYSITIFFGIIAFWVLGNTFDQPYLEIISYVSLVVVFITILLRKPLMRLLPLHFKIQLKRKDLHLFSIGALRYIVFLTQYLIILLILQPDISILLTSSGIALVYLIKSTAISTNLISDMGIREGAALLVLGHLKVLPEIILASGIIIWGINILIPSLIGSILLIKSRK